MTIENIGIEVTSTERGKRTFDNDGKNMQCGSRVRRTDGRENIRVVHVIISRAEEAQDGVKSGTENDRKPNYSMNGYFPGQFVDKRWNSRDLI